MLAITFKQPIPMLVNYIEPEGTKDCVDDDESLQDFEGDLVNDTPGGMV